MKKKYLLPVLFFLIDASAHAQENGNNSLLWRINSKGAGAPSYLFGTIHLPQKKFVVYSDSVYAAIQNTNSFYNEIDFTHQSIFEDTAVLNFLHKKRQHFDSLQKTDGWKRLIDKINSKYDVQLSYEGTEQFVDFSQRFMADILEPEEGMTLPDMMLAKHAVLLGKKAGGLETFQMQVSMLYEILDARLKDTTMQFEDERELTTGLKKFYINEQMDSLSGLIEQINPTYKDIVFNRRNETMTDSITKHISETPSFFAIGVGHLGGRQGVIELLRKKGFIMTPVYSGNKISILIINNIMKMGERFREGQKEEINEVRIDTSGVKNQTTTEAVQEPPPPPPQIPYKKAQIAKPAATKPKIQKKP